MQKLFDFVVKYKEFISFTALVIISLSLISMGDVSKIGGYRTFIVGSMGWFQEIFSWVPNPGAVLSENKALRNLNLQLSTEVTRMRQAVIENKKLRHQIGFIEKSEYKLIPAELAGRTSIEMRNFVTINKGTAHGIKRGMSVRTDAGLVGIVIGATKRYALVELITNRDIKIAGKVQRNNINGIVTWGGGSVFNLKNIPKSFDIQLKDTILTSNYSNKYPSNIPIGYISNIEDDPSALFKIIEIQPFAQFNTLEQVFVINMLPNKERVQLIEKIDELFKARAAKKHRKPSKQSSEKNQIIKKDSNENKS